MWFLHWRRFVAVLACLGAALADARATERRGADVEDLAALVDLGGMLSPNLALSPDGNEIALFERRLDPVANDWRHTLVVIDLATGRARAIADAGATILASQNGRRSGAPFDRIVQWSNDGAWLYFQRETEGRVELWRAPRDGRGAPEPLYADDADVARFRLDDNRLFFETRTPRAILAAQRQAEDAFGFRVDMDFSPLYALRPLPDERQHALVWRLDLTNGMRIADRDASLEAPRDQNAPLIAPLDPASDASDPPLGLFSNAMPEAVRCTAPACGGALEAAWRGESGDDEIIFLRLEGFARALSALYAWRPDDNAIRLIRREHDKVEGCRLAARDLICLHQGLTQPRRLVAVNVATGRMRLLYDPNPHWTRLAMPRIERIDFTDADGVASFAHLIYPLHWRRGQFAPLVIVQYRWRGLLRAGTGDETPILPLSAQGYAVLSVDRPEFDARAATTPLDQLQRDLELEGLENAAKRRAIRFFIDEAIARGVADGARVGLTGMSDGAETVFDLITHDHYAAAIVSSPPLDPSAWSLNSARFRQSRARRLGMSAPWSDASPAWRDWWRTHNITDQTDRIETPILLNLAESEAIRAFPFIARMEETRTPLEAYIYPGAFHLKSRPSHLLAAQRRTMAWLDFWLRDIDAREDGDPTRAARWAEMRARFEARRPLGSDVR